MVDIQQKDKFTITQTYANGEIGALILTKNQIISLYKKLDHMFCDVVDHNNHNDICEYCKYYDTLNFEHPCVDCMHQTGDSYFERKKYYFERKKY